MDNIQVLVTAIKSSQAVLAKWVAPDSNMESLPAIDQLLSILDDKNLIIALREFEIITEKAWPTSGNVERTLYDGERGILTVTYRNQKKYQYMDVPANVWEDLLKAESIGKFLSAEIKGHYRYMEI